MSLRLRLRWKGKRPTPLRAFRSGISRITADFGWYQPKSVGGLLVLNDPGASYHVDLCFFDMFPESMIWLRVDKVALRNVVSESVGDRLAGTALFLYPVVALDDVPGL